MLWNTDAAVAHADHCHLAFARDRDLYPSSGVRVFCSIVQEVDEYLLKSHRICLQIYLFGRFGHGERVSARVYEELRRSDGAVDGVAQRDGLFRKL